MIVKSSTSNIPSMLHVNPEVERWIFKNHSQDKWPRKNLEPCLLTNIGFE